MPQGGIREEGTRDVLKARLVRYSRLLSIVIMILGVLVLAGWVFDIGFLQSFFPGADPMTANAAILFVLGGLLLFICNIKTANKHHEMILIVISILMIAVATLTTLEYMFSVNFGIDELIFDDPVYSPGTFPPGRMTLLAAINFILMGFSILMMHFKKWMNFSQALTTFGILLGGLSLIGYLYGVDSLYDISSYTQMTFPTTIAGITLNAGILLSRPDDGFMRIITSNTLGGMMARRLLPMAIAVPLVIGWVRLAAEIIGLYSINVGVSLMVFSTIISMVVIIWLNALFLHRLDISRKQLERDIIKAMEKAESATKAKSEFLANMSHEIRTPVNGITGMISLALDTEMTDAQREYLNHASSSARTLTRIIDDILDFSKIEAGKLEMEAVDFNLDETFEELMALFSNDAKVKGLDLRCNIHPNLPRDLSGDPLRLKQILMNLLRNAIKFTHRGSISLRAEPLSVESGTLIIKFTVSDTGIGIPDGKKNIIFEEFSQVDGSTTRLYGGTGLGLAISKKLVKMMNGRIWVESTLGEGSAFHFTASFVPGKPSVKKIEERTSMEMASIPSGLRIYLADDNEVNRILMNDLLAKVGASVTTVDNGLDMLEAFKKEAPDLILMDIQMPKLDGVETTRRIRDIEAGTGTHTPIIAVTGHALRGDRERFLAAGMDGYIPEPIDITAFFDMVGRFTALLPPRQPTDQSEEPEPGRDEWVDIADFRKRVRDDMELMDRLLKIYLEDSKVHLAQIEGAVRGGDSAELESAAHSLKGMSANLSAYKVSELASRLEDAGESGNMMDVGAILNHLRESLNKTISYIELYLNERK